MNIVYINSNNHVLDFTKKYMVMNIDELFSNEFETENGRIIDYRTQGTISKQMEVDAIGVDWKEHINELNDVILEDVMNGKKGKFYIDDYFLRCNITAVSQNECNYMNGIESFTLTLTSDSFCWIREETHSFVSTSAIESTDTKRYPYIYPYRYHPRIGTSDLYNLMNIPTHYVIRIYGPASNPSITINRHVYQVFTNVERNEYLEIDYSSESTRTISRYKRDGGHIDEFNNRSKQSTIFKQIDPGLQPIVWKGDFSFDVVLIDERSQPKWI